MKSEWYVGDRSIQNRIQKMRDADKGDTWAMGEIFEERCSCLFPKEYFDLIDFNPSISGRFKAPRPEFKWRCKSTGEEFYVECKFISNTVCPQLTIYLGKYGQDAFEWHRNMAKEETKVFVIIGNGNHSYEPFRIYCINLEKVDRNEKPRIFFDNRAVKQRYFKSIDDLVKISLTYNVDTSCSYEEKDFIRFLEACFIYFNYDYKNDVADKPAISREKYDAVSNEITRMKERLKQDTKTNYSKETHGVRTELWSQIGKVEEDLSKKMIERPAIRTRKYN